MALDYRKQWESFQQLSFEDRKEAIVWFLDTLRQYNETLQTIYEYITTSEKVTDQDLFEVYEAVLYGMKQDDDQQAQSAMQQLDAIKDRMIERQRVEAAERKKETENAEMLLMSF